MKKLVTVYFVVFAIAAVFLYGVSLKSGLKNVPGELPDKISVYFHESGKTEEVDFEEYVLCVVSAEVPSDFEKQAIMAQAVAARTYIYNKYKKFSENPALAPDEHKTAVVCTDSKHCCAYSDREKYGKAHGSDFSSNGYKKLRDAVYATKGEIVLYEGEPIIAVFHSSSGGGRTENSRDVWSGDYPYLVSVKSADEDKREGYNSTVEISCDEFRDKISEKFPESGLGADRNEWLGDITFTDGNNVDYINIGKAKVKGTEMRSIFGLKSACFEISMLDDFITFHVHGFGHGVGMSQHGANFMAKAGAGYREILTHYYSGTEIVSL